MDYVLNGQPVGNVAAQLLANNFDPCCLRPYLGRDGRSYITRNSGRYGNDGKPVYEAVPVTNTTATLRKDDWILLDQVIIKAAKRRLKAFADLRSAGLTYAVPNAMGKTVLESENMSDIGPATTSMDGLRRGDNDRPIFDLVNLPLPITHKDFSFSVRQIAASRNGGSPLDTTTAELAAENVAIQVEKMLLGVADTYSFAGSSVYGYTNFPSRLVASMTLPTAAGWTGATLLNEIMAMKAQSVAAYHYGPWKLYNSPAWDIYLDADYSNAKGENTLRERLAKVQGVSESQTLDYLTGYQFIMVQQSPNVARAVIGMDITSLQWESHGGMQQNFKVMCILVPQLRTDQNSNTGLVHGTAA